MQEKRLYIMVLSPCIYQWCRDAIFLFSNRIRVSFDFSDEEISFAAVQGFVAARCTIIYFNHNDLNDLVQKLDEIDMKEKEKVS